MSDSVEVLKAMLSEVNQEIDRCVHDYDKFHYNLGLSKKWALEDAIKVLEEKESGFVND